MRPLDGTPSSITRRLWDFMMDLVLAEIVRIAMTMNPSGKRKYSERDILNSLFPDEGIVYATGNRG